MMLKKFKVFVLAVFELGMNESVRLCMKIEDGFQQLRQHLGTRYPCNRHLAIISLLELMQILDRPDLRSKLLNLIKKLQIYLRALINQQPSMQKRIMDILIVLEDDVNYLRGEQNKWSSCLYEDLFLQQLKLQINTHSLSAYKMSPLCQTWYGVDDAIFFANFQKWTLPLMPVEAIVSRLNKLLRDKYISIVYETFNGFSQWELDKNEGAALLGLVLPFGIIPSVSFGQQIVSINFHYIDYDKNNSIEQYQGHLRFEFMMSTLPNEDFK